MNGIDVCEFQHQRIDDKLREHDEKFVTQDKKLEIHDEQIAQIKLQEAVTTAATNVQIKNLVEQLTALVADVKRSNNLLITTLITFTGVLFTFVIWYIQQPK